MIDLQEYPFAKLIFVLSVRRPRIESILVAPFFQHLFHQQIHHFSDLFDSMNLNFIFRTCLYVEHPLLPFLNNIEFPLLNLVKTSLTYLHDIRTGANLVSNVNADFVLNDHQNFSLSGNYYI